MSEANDVVIAGSKQHPTRKTCGDWRVFRLQLTAGAQKAVWNAAFKDYFHARLRLRYLEPIELLQRMDARQGEGFRVMAIHCSLIEFLETIFQGKTYRYRRQSDPPLGPSEYSDSGKIFLSFLCNRKPFANVFDEPLAREFYTDVRCALLHEARTRNSWKINTIAPSGAILNKQERIIFHKNFQSAILETVEWYRKSLSNDKLLQEAFVRKFDSLCD